MSENGNNRHHFDFADFRLYPRERLLIRDDVRIALTPRILDTLVILVEHGCEIVRRETLMEAVWGDSFVEESNISRAISTLRQNLGVQANGSDFIETIPKTGYRFIAPVEEFFDDLDNPSTGSRPSQPRSRLWPAAGAVAIVAAAVFFYQVSRQAAPIVSGGMTNVTNNLAEDDMPAWSPDGKKISFTSNRDGRGHIFVMNADGSGVKRLTNSTGAEYNSTWSPDGTKIVFDSDQDGNKDIYVINSDGSGQTRLTFNPTADAGPASFSPDSKKIVFARSASNDGPGMYNYDIYTMNPDGTDVRQLTTDPEYDAEPIWSPDGKRIMFLSGRDHNFEIYAINPDGTGEINLTNSPGSEGVIAFTADGRQMYCYGDSLSKPDLPQIWLRNSDGSAPRQISSFDDKIYRVAYSIAARKFAIASKKEGNLEIYIMDAGGVVN